MEKKPSYEELERKIEELSKRNNLTINPLIKNSFDMIVLLDADGIQRYVSESCEKILGYKSEELIDIPVIDEMLHPEDQGKVLNGFKEILEKNRNGGVQYRHKHKKGGWVYLEANGTNQINNPAIKSVVLNVRDVTDRKLAEQALKESEARLSELNATKDRIFSIIGHDLRSPLNSILGFSELLLDQIKSRNYESIEEYASIIKNSSERVSDLLTNILVWSQTQTGKINFNPEYFKLTTVVDEVIDLMNDWALQKSIHISKKLPQNLKIIADKSMINNILRNFLSNGIKFTNVGGEIIIKAEKNNHEVIVSVTDNGVGINDKDIDKLFRLEYTYSTNGTKEESGTGLGLLLCKEFVNMHSGKIMVESTVEKGTTFSFTIPQD
ncbi:MAG: PAS domain S-box protein [Bacteroidales bacterium]|nr:PAS domain S-box protein [Bacteroidales bacterium]